jgi:hypothetical protein
MAEKHDGPLPGSGRVRQAQRLVGKVDPEDEGAGRERCDSSQGIGALT